MQTVGASIRDVSLDNEKLEKRKQVDTLKIVSYSFDIQQFLRSFFYD